MVTHTATTSFPSHPPPPHRHPLSLSQWSTLHQPPPSPNPFPCSLRGEQRHRPASLFSSGSATWRRRRRRRWRRWRRTNSSGPSIRCPNQKGISIFRKFCMFFFFSLVSYCIFLLTSRFWSFSGKTGTCSSVRYFFFLLMSFCFTNQYQCNHKIPMTLWDRGILIVCRERDNCQVWNVGVEITLV